MRKVVFWAGCLLVAIPARSDEQLAPDPSSQTFGAQALVPRPIVAPTTQAIDEAQRRGVAFLIESQNKDGSWGSAERTKGLNIYAPVPGAHHAFRAAVTSMCVSALIEVGGESAETKQAVERGEEWLFTHLSRVRRADQVALYNNWAHGYAIQALARMFERLPDDHERRRRIVAQIEQQVELLGRYESVDGGWGYYDFRAQTKKPSSSSTSFMTAAILVTLHDAKAIGADVPDKLVQRAIDSIHRQHKPDGSYLYGEYLKWRPMHPVNRPGGSLGRSQACNVALRRWGDPHVSDAVLAAWLNRLYARNLWLDLGRKKPVPHDSWFAVAGYFFYFGHYYAALCMEELPADERGIFQDHLAYTLLRLQEKDGSWWDYPLYNYHQPYGTSFALMSLARCKKAESPSVGKSPATNRPRLSHP